MGKPDMVPSCMLRCLKTALVTALATSLFTLVLILNSAQYYPPQSNLLSPDEITRIAIMPEGGAPPGSLPWTTSSPVLITKDEDYFNGGNFVTGNFSFSPGQGNLMFQYASMLGIARSNNATLIIHDSMLLRRAFDLKQSAMVEFRLWANLARRWPRFIARDCCRYYLATQNLNHSQQLVMGYLQSFRYFHHIREEILREFQFLPEIRQKAQAALTEALKGQSPDVLVAIHVRRGVDMTWNLRNMEHGHTVATIDYFKNAMKYFREKFAGQKLTFVVATDDTYWSRTKLLDSKDVTIVTTRIREVDMAALTLCNHTIMSQGTYSWWIAYMTGGETVYYQDWPRNGSRLSEMLKRDDFYLPNWIPMR